MRELRFLCTLKFRNDAVGQYLSQLDAPLVERIDMPDRTLNEDLVLIECDQLAQRLRCQSLHQNGVRRAIALESPVRNLEGWYSIGCNLLGRLAEGQGLSLRDEVRHQQIVVRFQLVQGLIEANKIARDQLGPLVDKLVERGLAIRSRLSPDDRPRLIVYLPALQVDMFSIALHIQLLEIGGQEPEVMIIGQDRDGLGTEEVVVPDTY